MKVILLSNVRKVGQKGAVVEVAEGYGRNFLIKNGLAKAAVGGELKNLKNQKVVAEKSKDQNKEKAEEKFKEINKKSFIIKKPANENGHLFAAIHQKDIAELLKVTESDVFLTEEIKKVGEFTLKVQLENLKAKVTLVVEAA